MVGDRVGVGLDLDLVLDGSRDALVALTDRDIDRGKDRDERERPHHDQDR